MKKDTKEKMGNCLVLCESNINEEWIDGKQR
jgi:hypothetical protein